MKLSVLYSRAAVGISAPLVSVETHVSHGMPGFTIVGLPEAAVKESKERVRSAIINSGLKFTNKKIIINLAPADLPKEGGRFDLPIAVGILAATEQLPGVDLTNFEFAGELALTGNLRPINGIIPFALATSKTNRTLIISEDNFSQASLIENIKIYPFNNLLSVYNYLRCRNPINLAIPAVSLDINHKIEHEFADLDLKDLVGQHLGKRALEIAAAGKHNLLMVGSPGTGKTMLANRLLSILPNLSNAQAVEVAAIYSLKGLEREKCWALPPFRYPHHTISSAALFGGGSTPKPGEISLAHNGILFLDELLEFNSNVLEVLREPMESGKIVIARAKQQLELPARFQLIAAMNPCPCGNFGNVELKCSCSRDKIKRYLYKLSGPLLDRIDICVEIPMVDPRLLVDANKNPININNSNTIYSSENIKAKVTMAYNMQLQRQNSFNANLNNRLIKDYCKLNQDCEKILQLAITKFKLSARSYYKILKIARTIADLDAVTEIKIEHIQEAINLNKMSILHYY